MPPSGVETVQQFWDEYRAGFAPPLSTSLLLAGREQLQKIVCDGMSAGVGNLSSWKADAATEAAAFLAACILTADTEFSNFLLSKTLIIQTEDAARRLPITNSANLICFPPAGKVGSARSQRNQVILVLGNSERADNAQILERMNTRDFAAGLQAMGIEEQEAFRLAATCGRSITVLSRLRASGLKPLPAWHENTDLIPLVLAGAWDARNEHDRAVVAKLCNKPYDQVDADARKFASLPDAPIDLEGSVWAIRSATDGFMLLGRLVDSATQLRLRDACITVFSEIDLTLDVPDDKRPVIPTRGADFRHSEWLRRGLSKTLLLISGLHEAAEFRLIDRSPENYVDDVVASLPGLTTDVRLLASLKSQFPTLAEAAPVPLVSALEQVLGGDCNRWASVIFRDKQNQSLWGSFSPHTHILWALETIAWSPLYLYRAASVLMRMSQCDPGGGLQNRPLRSLRDIFLAWRPHTFASVDERTAVLRQICLKNPNKGLELAMSLLPQNHDHTTGTAKPRVRDFGDAKSAPINNGEISTAFTRYSDLAVELASSDFRSLTSLVDNVPQLSEETRARIFSAIRNVAESASAEEIFALWTKLNDLIQKHTQFQGADWAMPLDNLKPLEDLRNELQPNDPVKPILWLFDNYVPRIGRRPAEGYVEQANRERKEVISALFQQHGLSNVLALAKQSKLPHFVGFALAEAAPKQEVLEQAISLGMDSQSVIDQDFSIAISAQAHQIYGAAWDKWISKFAKELPVDRAANLFFRWTDSQQTWDFVKTLGKEIEDSYWKSKPVYKQTSDDDFRVALNQYMERGRFSACIEMASYAETRLSTETLLAILRGFMARSEFRALETPAHSIRCGPHDSSSAATRRRGHRASGGN